MAIEKGVQKISLGSNRPEREPAAPANTTSRSKSRNIGGIVFGAFENIAEMRVFIADTIGVNGSGLPKITFSNREVSTGYIIPAGLLDIDGHSELRINGVFVDTSYYNLYEDGENIVADFGRSPGYSVDSNDTVEIRARIK